MLLDVGVLVVTGIAAMVAALSWREVNKARKAAEKSATSAARSADAAEESAASQTRLVEVERQRDMAASRPTLSAKPGRSGDDRIFVWVVNEGDTAVDEVQLKPSSASPALFFEGRAGGRLPRGPRSQWAAARLLPRPAARGQVQPGAAGR